MKIAVKFQETNNEFALNFGAVHTVSDGGYEKGYTEGYEQGNNDGYAKGHTDGLAERRYEVWTITLTDGTVLEKEVALL